MFTIRNVGGVALLLAGSTWMWLTPAFAGPEVTTSGMLWGLTGTLALLTVAGFAVATWGLFTRHSWWETAAVASAALGLLAVATFAVAALAGGQGLGTVAWNAFVHVLIVVGVLALLLVPQLERWVDVHVMRR
jgi:hypothetical protein